MNNSEKISFLDSSGKPIRAHGGCILFHQGFYYWYGEDREGDTYIRCYKSEDLTSWIDCGPVITSTTPKKNMFSYMTDGLTNCKGGKVNLERPKVIYNKQSGMFIMYVHYENGIDYLEAAIGVAFSFFPDKNFIYLGHYRPFGYMSRDCTLFVDDDQSAYFISASNDNLDLMIYKLSDDYLEIDSRVNTLFKGLSREAPALIKQGGIYYLFTSGCTGWFPNQCMFSFSSSIEGEWSELIKIGDINTFHSQPAFIIRLNGSVYYVGDVWGGYNWDSIKGFDYERSTYLLLSIKLNGKETAFKLTKTKMTRKT